MKIVKGTRVSDILKTYPETFQVFKANGFKYKSVEDFINSIGEKTMLMTLTSVKNINIDIFIEQLENEINIIKNEQSYLLDDVKISDNVDFYGSVIFPIKITLKNGLENIIKKNLSNGTEPLKCHVKAGNITNDYSDNIKFNPSIDTLPNVYLSKEFKEPLGRDFREKLMDKGYFKGDFYSEINADFNDIKILDSEYVVYSVIPIVFLIDKKKLGDMPRPKTLKDILNPIYENNIVLFGKEKDCITSPSFFYIYKEFGMDGIRALSRNVKTSIKSAKIGKHVGSKDGAAIYLMPWIFANTCYKKDLEIIWPSDGAMVLPMYMLVKKDKADRVKGITDYLIGQEFGMECARSNFPSLNKNVNNSLPKGASFKWLGWDYIRENDVVEIEKKCEEIFMEEWEEFHSKGGER